MNWAIMLRNFREAKGELSGLRNRLSSLRQTDINRPNSDFNVYALFVSLGHAYHHVNFAWNSRRINEARVVRCITRDFNAWEKFSRSFKTLWPSPSQCKGRPREAFHGRLALVPIKIAVDEAIMSVTNLYDAISASGENAVEIAESELAEGIEMLYRRMNRIRNDRKLDLRNRCKFSATSIRRHSSFPRAFKRLWYRLGSC